ncbi:MAG: PorP/SprF family type IX secretion system membrane protein [Muribaculaceae bacterium]|nr:PorP/SprF family type IX secretion system membrane protein [Muribaculaceae bacterium]
MSIIYDTFIDKSACCRANIARLSIVVAMIWGAVFNASAQSEMMLTQSWEVPTYYNPAATGTTDYIRIRAGAKLQWLGITNAPKSFFGVADAPFKIGSKRIGVGVNISQESLGLFSNLLANVQASYKFKLLKGVFSVGVQGGYYNSRFRATDIYIPDEDDYHESTDTSLPTQDLSGNAFDFSAGIHYQHRYFSVGIAGLHLLNPVVKMNVQGSEASDYHEYETELTRSLYLTADGNIPVKNTLFSLQPSILASTNFERFTAQATMRATYNKFITFGAGYRWQEAVYATIGAEFKNFYIGYAYDYPLSAIGKASSGSHELILGYQLKLDFSGKNRNKHRSIRIM